MISGKLALGGVSLEFGEARKSVEELTAEVDRLEDRHTQLIAEERRVVDELARIYLPDLSPESVSGALRGLESRMREARERHELHKAELAERLADEDAKVDERAAEVEALEATEEHTAAEVDATRAAVEAELGADAEHAEMARSHREVMDRRSMLKSRRAKLVGVANVERARYEAYAPLRYLRERGFGEERYRGGFVTRRLDRWLANRIGYERLSQRYRILREGPHIIQAEIRRLTEVARELEGGLDARQDEVGERHGLLAALATDAEAQKRVVEARKLLAEATERRDATQREMRAVEADRGEEYEEAIEMHEDFLRHRSTQELEQLARRTGDTRDDALVSRLDDVRRNIEFSARQLAGARNALTEASSRTDALADLARAAAARFSSRRSFFPEEGRLRNAVRALLDGEATTDETLDWMHAEHIPRRVIDGGNASELNGWFSELASRYDPELAAATMRVERDGEIEDEIVVHDADGRVLHRRVTRRTSRHTSS